MAGAGWDHGVVGRPALTLAGGTLAALVALWCPGCNDECLDGEIEPSVDVSASPTAGPAPLEVTLHARLGSGWTDSCQDKKVPPESLVWDVDGDEVIDVVDLDARTVTTVFEEPGEYVASAQVFARAPNLAVGDSFRVCSCTSCRDCSKVTITVE